MSFHHVISPLFDEFDFQYLGVQVNPELGTQLLPSHGSHDDVGATGAEVLYTTSAPQ